MLYDYHCEHCNLDKERIASLEEYEVNRIVCCDKCNRPMKRVITAPAFIGKKTTRYNPNYDSQDSADRNAFESMRILEKNGKLTKQVSKEMDAKNLLRRKSELTRMTPVSRLGG